MYDVSSVVGMLLLLVVLVVLLLVLLVVLRSCMSLNEGISIVDVNGESSTFVFVVVVVVADDDVCLAREIDLLYNLLNIFGCFSC
jgi:hypothetical protein